MGLRAVFVQFGTVVWLKVLEPRSSDASDCVALVQMASVDEASAAVDALHGRVLAGPLPPMRVRFAGKEQEPSSNLYIAGLPTTKLHDRPLESTGPTLIVRFAKERPKKPEEEEKEGEAE